MATRWSPDTCGCEFIINDPTNLEHGVEQTKKCNIHADETILTAIEENRGKNRAIARLVNAGIHPESVTWEFEKKGRGRRLCKLSVPSAGARIGEVELDDVDKAHTQIQFR